MPQAVLVIQAAAMAHHPFRGPWSRVMAAATALRQAWSRVLRRAGPWRRPSLWVPSVVPPVRRDLGPMDKCPPREMAFDIDNNALKHLLLWRPPEEISLRHRQAGLLSL